MPGVQGVASGRLLSAGATVLIGAGLALYQLTSLVLGPVANRQLDFSLTMPTNEGQDLSEPVAPAIKVVVGTRATPAAPVARVSPSRRVASMATARASSQPRPAAVASPPSKPAGKKHHADD